MNYRCLHILVYHFVELIYKLKMKFKRDNHLHFFDNNKFKFGRPYYLI